MDIEKLKEMFAQVVVKKAAALIPLYYHQNFLLYTNDQITDYNDQITDYDAFIKSHQEYYATSIKYEIAYDEETFLEQGEKIAGRVWITTTRPNESPKKIEVILIVQFKDSKIYRLWELTYPDWSKLPAFM